MPGGRPSKINDQVAVVDGRPITAGEQVVSAIRAGNYLETAAAMAGVHKDTVYEWLKVGAQAHGTGKPAARLTAHQRRCMAFSDAVAQATAQAEAEDVARLAALGRGGLPVKVETVKVDGNGNVLERTTRSEVTLPEAKVLMWRLERRFAKRWGQKGSLEVTGADGGALTIDLADTARSLITDQLDRIAGTMDQLAGPAIEPPPAVTPGPEDGEPAPEV